MVPRRPEIEFNELVFWAFKPSSLNSVCKCRKRVQRTRFLGIETEFFELSFWARLKTPVTHPYTFKKTYIVIIPSHSRSLSHSLTLLSLSLSLTLLSLSDSPPSPLPSLCRHCRLSHSLAEGVTSQSCKRPRPLHRRRRLSHSLAVSLTHSTPSLLFS